MEELFKDEMVDKVTMFLSWDKDTRLIWAALDCVLLILESPY